MRVWVGVDHVSRGLSSTAARELSSLEKRLATINVTNTEVGNCLRHKHVFRRRTAVCATDTCAGA